MGLQLCVLIVIFVTFMGKSDGLQCYNCQRPVPESGEDPCKEAPLETCSSGNSRCLSAKFSVSAEPFKSEKEVISALTCFPDMNGLECEFFQKKVQQTTPPLFRVQYADKCEVCSTDGCNIASESTQSRSTFMGIALMLFTVYLNFNLY